MINEFLHMTYRWCGSDSTIIQGYILCDDPIKECQIHASKFTGPATFSDEFFKILAARKDDYNIVIIFSNRFLIDPSKCSFICSTSGKQLPFYPKYISLAFDPLTNYRITLKNNQNPFNLRVQMFFNTFERSVAQGQLIPILICPKQLLSNVWEYLIEQSSFTETLDELQEAVQFAQREVKLSNAIIANTLINGCALFQKYIQIKPKYTKREMENDIMNLVFSDLEHSVCQIKNIPSYISQSGKFIQQLMILVKNMISQFFLFIEETIELIMENEFDSQELCYVLEGQIENQVGKFTITMHEFALVEQADFIILFEKIKETIFDIHKDIEKFILKTSAFVDEQMQKVNQIFQDYPALANVRTFQAIQTDASQHIVHELRETHLAELSNFWRPEFQKKTEFIKKILISYLDYKEEKLNLPAKTPDFYYSLIRMGLDPKMPIQTIQIIVDKNDQDFIKEKNLLVCKISTIQNGKRKAFKIYLQTNEEIVLYMIKNQVVIVSFDYFNKELWVEQEIKQVSITLSAAVKFILETDIEYIKNIQLYEFDGNITQSDIDGQSKLLVNFSMDMQDQLKVVKKQFFKKIQKAQKVGGPQATDPTMLAAGAIGSGLGIFIVDCLDDNISWQQKLQRAGFGTAETTAFAALSMNLPFVGFLVGQTFLFYAVHKVFSNKVLSMQNKMKNMGHLGIKTSMGVGSAVAGQILIPIPVLGALIGSVVGGVGVGLYHKFIIPSTRNSLFNMIGRLEQYIQENGQLKYEKEAIKVMRINPDHFFINQPQSLNCSDWLTLISVHLVNEISYLFELQCEEKRKKLLEKPDNAEKIEKLITLDNKQDQAEEQFCKWEIVRYYVYKENISTFKYAKQVGEFVAGMIGNFKL